SLQPPPPPPSPIPTGEGSRSAAGPVLSDYIDKSTRVPELTLPQHVRRRELEEISYGSLLFRDNEAVRSFLRLAREKGVFRIGDHGIPTEELRLALAHSDRIFFGSAVECLTSYGDHEKLVWRGDDHGREMMEEAGRAVNIGDDNLRNLWKTMENLAGKMEEIAGELAEVIDEYLMDTKQSRMVMIVTGLMEKPNLSIHRYHRANIIDRISSSLMDETISGDQSGPYALSLHVLLESGELCVQTEDGKLLFGTSADAIVVTMGKQIEASFDSWNKMDHT
ncbi:uncharacterized protein, partial [Henckelia pumila]|uniref:uncharacterized protein n=1 Tax=Henckelia pumila TaxID=405737 RepID=UPI003C6E7A82